MPCNMVAVVMVELQVADANELRNNAQALQVFQAFLNQLTQLNVNVTVAAPTLPERTMTTFTVDYNRRIEIGPSGVQLYGRWSEAERKSIKDFLDGLCVAAAEEKLVQALATQLPLLSDQQLIDDAGAYIGRALVVRV